MLEEGKHYHMSFGGLDCSFDMDAIDADMAKEAKMNLMDWSDPEARKKYFDDLEEEVNAEEQQDLVDTFEKLERGEKSST